MQRETLASQGVVEGFDERIVHRLAASAELERDMMPVGPVVQELRGELGAIVDGDALGESPIGPDGGQDARDVPA